MILLSELLFESVLTKLQKQYPDLAQELQEYATVLPKYLPWIAKQLKLGNLDNYAPEEVMGVLTQFEDASKKSLLRNSDIGTYENLFAVENAIRNRFASRAERELSKQFGDQTEEVEEPKQNTIYNDARYTVVEPLNKAAACSLGSPTWCISRTSGVNFFNRATYRNAKQIFIIDKQAEHPEYANVAVTIYPDGNVVITDATNTGIPMLTFLGLYPDHIIELFDEYLNAGFSTSELAALGLT